MTTQRRCGDCQLCCKLLPMAETPVEKIAETAAMMIVMGDAAPSDFNTITQDFYKPANTRCQYQSHHKGCSIYDRRPFGCRFWTCRWLTDQCGPDIRRPDRVHYVIDAVSDVVTAKPGDGSEPIKFPVIVIWCDPSYPLAYRDPALAAYIDEQGKNGYAALIRFDESKAITVFPPSLTGDGTFHEVGDDRSRSIKRESTSEERFEVLGEDHIDEIRTSIRSMTGRRHG